MGDFSVKDLYKSSWRRVQALADMFRSRWCKEYLHVLQTRRRWCNARRNFEPGDVVILRDKSVARSQWPLGVVVNAFKSSDNYVRKVEVRIINDGKPCVYTRPIRELALVVPQ